MGASQSTAGAGIPGGYPDDDDYWSQSRLALAGTKRGSETQESSAGAAKKQRAAVGGSSTPGDVQKYNLPNSLGGRYQKLTGESQVPQISVASSDPVEGVEPQPPKQFHASVQFHNGKLSTHGRGTFTTPGEAMEALVPRISAFIDAWEKSFRGQEETFNGPRVPSVRQAPTTIYAQWKNEVSDITNLVYHFDMTTAPVARAFAEFLAVNLMVPMLRNEAHYTSEDMCSFIIRVIDWAQYTVEGIEEQPGFGLWGFHTPQYELNWTEQKEAADFVKQAVDWGMRRGPVHEAIGDRATAQKSLGISLGDVFVHAWDDPLDLGKRKSLALYFLDTLKKNLYQRIGKHAKNHFWNIQNDVNVEIIIANSHKETAEIHQPCEPGSQAHVPVPASAVPLRRTPEAPFGVFRSMEKAKPWAPNQLDFITGRRPTRLSPPRPDNYYFSTPQVMGARFQPFQDVHTLLERDQFAREGKFHPHRVIKTTLNPYHFAQWKMLLQGSNNPWNSYDFKRPLPQYRARFINPKSGGRIDLVLPDDSMLPMEPRFADHYPEYVRTEAALLPCKGFRLPTSPENIEEYMDGIAVLMMQLNVSIRLEMEGKSHMAIEFQMMTRQTQGLREVIKSFPVATFSPAATGDCW